MKITQLLLTTIVLLCCASGGIAQLNDVKIGNCTTPAQINSAVAFEKTKGLVMDARPFAINQATGKLLFTRGDGRVSVVHMNPFIYNYKISVAQQELISTAVTDFLKLLLPPSLSPLVGTQSGLADRDVAAAAPGGLRLLEQRLSTFSLAACKATPGASPDACDAAAEMAKVFKEIKASVDPPSATLATLDSSTITIGGVATSTNTAFRSYSTALTALRNEELDSFNTCQKAESLNTTLNGYDFDTYFQGLNAAQREISRITSLANDLIQLTTAFNADTDLKDKPVRCSGFKCVGQFLAYANEIKAVLGDSGYQAKLNDLRNKGQDMQNMFLFTQQLRSKDGMFARTFTIEKKYELSQATISVKREPLQPDTKANTAGGRTQSGTATSTDTTGTPGGGGAGSEGSFGNTFGNFVPPGQQSGAPGPQTGNTGDKAKDNAKEGEEKPGGSNALAGDVNEVVQLGRPRMMLSGGLVFSPLPRRTFKAVKGFVLDAQGNPTGNGDANVVGFDQNSPRRLFPMLFLNSRLLDYERGSLFFSFGITAKKDDNVDLEYLFGPSVSFLNDRALFTFGAYGGLTQNLVSDVRIGDAIPDSLGNAKFYTKRLTWKPGFSFSYSFSRTKKGEAKTSGGGKSSAAEELKDEIRIGSVPFNLALGLAFTSLEQRTYDAIAGFARDRQGNLTNGQTLTRIVGLTSSSDYRMTPMAMLHTRLTNFGARDFYFTTGITGKKTDNDFDLEYLLGGSVNIYRRKMFLTFGTFIGKQQLLGGNFFEGAALGKTQNVTTENRYVWKPTISFSYDISRIIPRPN